MILNFKFFLLSLFFKIWSWIFAISFMSFNSRLLKITISSSRFKNSGLKNFLSSLSITFLISFLSSFLTDKSFIDWLPKLLVRTMIEFLKFIVRPWPSVMIPSSRTCKRISRISLWAFSISVSYTHLTLPTSNSV